jgi:hypothetical protein
LTQSRCGYCYASKFQRNGEPFLTVEEIRDIRVQAKKLGAFTGFAVGGEPSLHKDFLDIVRAQPLGEIVEKMRRLSALGQSGSISRTQPRLRPGFLACSRPPAPASLV